MSDIDEQVAAFAAQLSDVVLTDPEQVANDVTHLAHAMFTAPTHHRAALALGEWFVSRNAHDEYTVAVARGAMAALGSHIALSHPVALAGPGGLLSRLFRLTEALCALTPVGIR